MSMSRTMGTLLTMTTYGTWLRGDRRGWVDDGIIMPAEPTLELADRRRLKRAPFLFSEGDRIQIGQFIGDSLQSRINQQILVLSVESWHVHLVVGATSEPVSRVVKCAKDAVRWGLRPSRPIWSDGYDKRFCFDDESLAARVRYVERHNERAGLGPRPWGFIEVPVLD